MTRLREKTASAGQATRREFIKTSGFLIASATAMPLDAFAFQTPGPYVDPDFRQLDSWIVIRADNTATFFVGKTDLGQGTGTAFRQIMSDELDIAFENTTCVMGRTDVTVDQGGSGGSDALQTDGYPMRRVAAEARRVLLEMASQHFGVPVSDLEYPMDHFRSQRRRSVSRSAGREGGYRRPQHHLRRADRRQEIQRHAHRQEHRHHHRHGAR